MADPVTWARFHNPAPNAPWWVRRRELIFASPARVWRAITEPAELVQWWCDSAEVDLRPHGAFEFGGPHVYGESHLRGGCSLGHPCEILEVEPESSLKLRWPLFGVSTVVHWELENHMEATRLTVTQTAEAAPGWDPGGGMDWWWVALPTLRAYVEKGIPELRLDYAALRASERIRLESRFTTFPWVIWSKLTTPSEVGRWWAPCSALELRVGGAFRLDLKEGGPSSVLGVNEGSSFTHDWRWGETTVSQVTWTIEEMDEDVLVRVEDKGPWPPGMPRDACGIRWAATLLLLQQMSERGLTPREHQD